MVGMRCILGLNFNRAHDVLPSQQIFAYIYRYVCLACQYIIFTRQNTHMPTQSSIYSSISETLYASENFDAFLPIDANPESSYFCPWLVIVMRGNAIITRLENDKAWNSGLENSSASTDWRLVHRKTVMGKLAYVEATASDEVLVIFALSSPFI